MLRIDCKSAKYVIEKDVENITSKHIFARWQAILSVFDFDIEYIKGSQNAIPDFLQSDLLNQKFLLRIDCKSAKYVIEKDVENITSKHIFARWQAILSVFD